MWADNFDYEINDEGEVILLKYNPKEECVELVTPRHIDGKPVVAIGPTCFKENGIFLNKITVSEGVREIAADAFSYAVSLIELNLPDTLVKLGADAVFATSLLHLSLPASLRVIERPEHLEMELEIDKDNPVYFSDGFGLYERFDDETGKGVRLVAVNSSDERASYTLDESTSHIIRTAMSEDEYLKELILPAGLKSVEARSFSSTANKANARTGIERIVLDSSNENFIIRDNCFFEKKEDGLYLIRFLGGDKLKLKKDVVCLYDEACKNTCLECLEIENPDIFIGENAFFACPLKECTILDYAYIYFGDEPDYIRDSLLQGLYSSEFPYDFTVLDNLLVNGEYINAARIAMMVKRLKHPTGLSSQDEETMRKNLSSDLKETIFLLDKNKDVDTCEGLGELAFFTEENIDSLIDASTAKDKKELTAWLMSYKNQHIGNSKKTFFL